MYIVMCIIYNYIYIDIIPSEVSLEQDPAAVLPVETSENVSGSAHFNARHRPGDHHSSNLGVSVCRAYHPPGGFLSRRATQNQVMDDQFRIETYNKNGEMTTILGNLLQ